MIDEEYWAQAVLPLPLTASLYQGLPLGDPEQLPAGSLRKFTSPDEDYWQNWASPVPMSFFLSPLFIDESDYKPRPLNRTFSVFVELPASTFLR